MRPPIRVLLVEDNPADAELVSEILGAIGPHLEVITVVDGAGALAYLHALSHFADAGPPALVLLDLNLPKVDGRAVLAELQQVDALRCVPVVVMSSSDAECDVLECRRLGAAGFVTKPLGLWAFRAAVRSIERRWLAAAGPP